MNNWSRFKVGKVFGFVILGITLLIIPQCLPGNNTVGSSVYGWLSHWFSEKSRYDLTKLEGKENVYPMVIIGSGPAGLSAGLYGARAKRKLW